MSDELNLSDMNWCKREIESLQQQLATAIAACKLKDEALQSLHDEKCDYMRLNKLGNPYLETNTKLAVKALAVQPDDSALKAWLGKPVGEVKKHTGSLKDMAIIVWSGEQPPEGAQLYSPKGI